MFMNIVSRQTVKMELKWLHEALMSRTLFQTLTETCSVLQSAAKLCHTEHSPVSHTLYQQEDGLPPNAPPIALYELLNTKHH